MTYRLCHVEIPVSDLKIAKDFYEKAVGWKVRIMDNQEYAMADTEQDVTVGFRLDVSTPDDTTMTPFVAAYDLDEALEKVKAAGGKVVLEPKPTPGVSRPYSQILLIMSSASGKANDRNP